MIKKDLEYKCNPVIFRTKLLCRFKKIIRPYFLIAPCYFLLLLVLLYPIGYQIYISFHDVSSSPYAFVGLQNYIDLLQRQDFSMMIWVSLVWTFGCLVGQFILGMSTALFLNNLRPGSRLFRAALLAPWVMPGVVTGIIWRWLYNPVYGVLNAILNKIHLPEISWLGSGNMALLSVIIANIWKGFPFWMIMITAGLQSIPGELHEAAVIDGANYWRRFWNITIPGLKTILIVTSILAFIWTYNFFDLIWVLTRGGPANKTITFPLYIYQQAFIYMNRSRASATALLFIILMTIGILLYARVASLRKD